MFYSQSDAHKTRDQASNLAEPPYFFINMPRWLTTCKQSGVQAMLRRRLAVVSHGLVAFSSFGCADTEPVSPQDPSAWAAAAACNQGLSDRAQRPGDAAVATLFYACDGDVCRGDEGFVSHVQQAISVELEAAPEAQIWLESSDERVFRLSDRLSAFDPCASRVVALATLEAGEPGEARLVVRDAAGELDRIPVWVGTEARIVLRVTPREAFAFETPASPIQARPGDSWLLLPELYDVRNALLVGRAQLTWTVTDTSLAAVYDQPEDSGEPLASLTQAAGMVLLEIRQPGKTHVRVQSDSGAEASLALEVTAP